MIGGNGAYVEHEDAPVLHTRLPRDQTRAVVSWVRSCGGEPYLETNAGLFASERFPEAALPAVRAYTAGAPTTVLSVHDAIHGLVLTPDLDRDDVNKISFPLTSRVSTRAARAAFPELMVGTWGGSGHEALFDDVSPAGVTKERAINALLDHPGGQCSAGRCRGRRRARHRDDPHVRRRRGHGQRLSGGQGRRRHGDRRR